MSRHHPVRVLIAFVILPCVLLTGVQEYSFPLMKGCAILGFKNATLNECGYCVGDETDLPEDFGKDCSGKCGGRSVIDCSGACGGHAFIDDCTGTCVNSSRQFIDWSVRDCRGTCVKSSHIHSGYTFMADKCGVCRLKSDTPSPFEDCDGNCLTIDRPRKSRLCSKCVHQSDAEVLLDECGNCRSEGMPCSCESNPSKCGCSDANNCYSVQAIHPQFVPKGLTRQLNLSGYFFPPKDEVQCVFRHENSGETISVPLRFDVKNRTTVTCGISLNMEGSWLMGLRARTSARNVIVADVHVTVFEKDSISFSSVFPSRISTANASNPVIIRFRPTDLSSVPVRSFRCKMSSIQDENLNLVSDEGPEPFTCLINPSGSTIRSQEWLVSPTFDGGEPLGQPLSLQVVSPVPQVSTRNSFLSADGLSIIVMFEKPVDLSSMPTSEVTLCLHILTLKTQHQLSEFGIRSCVWISKILFIIYLNSPTGDNDVEIEINSKVLREDYQHLQEENNDIIRIPLTRMTSEWQTYPSRLLITGPSEIPVCGTFALSGYLSTTKSSATAKFEWSLKRNDDKAISSDLQLLVELTAQEHLLLDASLFQEDLVYIFSLTVRLEGEVLTTEHKLWKYGYDAPVVSLFSSLMIPLTSPTVDQAKHFWAEVYVPACVNPVQRIVVIWKVTDPRILFNFSMAYSASYFMKPFSMQENHLTTLIVSSFLGHRSTQTTGAGFTFSSEDAPLRASIADSSITITVGSLSGSFSLSGQGFPATQPNVAYHWSCSDSQTHQPCYDMSLLNDVTNSRAEYTNDLDYLLVKKRLQMQQPLELIANQLQVDHTLIMSLRVADLNNSSRTSETEIVTVKIVPNSKLQLFIGPVIVNDVEAITIRNPQTSALLIPAHSKVSIRGRVKHPDGASKIYWSVPNFNHDIYWTTKKVSREWTETEATILPEFVFPYGVHSVRLHACEGQESCEEATLQIAVAQQVTGCQVVVAQSYVEYELITLTMDRCNTPPGLAPLSFQVSITDPTTMQQEPVTVAQFSKVFQLPGPAAFSESSRRAIFSVSICDTYENCQKFYSKEVEVKAAANMTARGRELLAEARRHLLSGGIAQSVNLLSTVMKIPDRDLAIEAADSMIANIVTGLETPSMRIRRGDAEVMFNAMSHGLRMSRDRRRVRRILSAIEKLSRKLKAFTIVPDRRSIDSLLQTIYDLMETANDSSILTQSRVTMRAITKAIAASIPIGSRVEFGKSSYGDAKVPSSYILAVHDNELRDVTLLTPFNHTSSVQVSISYGSQLVKDFTSEWQCEEQSLCQSVVVIYKLYPNKGPYSDDIRNNRISPTIEISIHSPITGTEKSVSGYLSAVSLEFTVTGQSPEVRTGFETKCQFWDEDSQTWQSDGVHILWQAQGKASCWSGHLTAFAVSRVRTSHLIGTAIGASLILLLACLLIALLSGCIAGRRKSRSLTKSSAQQLVSHL